MTMRCVRIAMIGAAVVLLPLSLAAQFATQMDPNSGTGTGQPAGQPGPASPAGQAAQQGSMRDSLGAPGETGQQMVDKQFLRTAVETGIADVKLAELATQKGGPDVKTLAQQLIDDHTAINKDLGEAADAIGVMLPRKMSKDEQAEYDKLNSLSGKDFDTEYLTYILKAHWQTLHSFYMEASGAGNADLQTQVTKAMSTMHQHVGLITKTATAEGITLPPRPPRPAATTTTAKQ
jgi:putative membrane protein